MSALHQAVARALRDARYGSDLGLDARDAELARAAVRVVLAEATRSIEALPTHTRVAYNPGSGRVAGVDLDRVLAVLVALGDEA